MKMKSLIKLGALFSILFSLASCDNNNEKNNISESTGPVYADGAFLADFASSLEARWDFAETNTDMSDKETLNEAITIESTILDKYKSEPFEDSHLQEKAISYINQLDEGKELLDTFGAESFYQNWDTYYGERTKFILEMTDSYDIPISENYQSTLDEMRAVGAEVKKEQEATEAVKTLFENAQFEYEPQEYDDTFKTYVAVIENTTGFDIANVSGNVNLIDADGVVISTQYIHADNWKNGQKYRFEFMDDKQFSKTEVTIDHFYLD